MIDKYLAEEEYEIVSKLAEVTEEITEWQKMKDWEAEMDRMEPTEL
jgi:hypothetical protein